MKKSLFTVWMLLVFMCFTLLVGCAESKPEVEVPRDTYQSVTPVGQVPEEFQRIVSDNLFEDAVAFENCLLKAEIVEANEEERTVTYRVCMMDLYGNELASHSCTTDDTYSVRILTATREGGFLFALGFSDRAYGQNSWASDNGYASRIICCDKAGNVQFDTPLDHVAGGALKYCFETEEGFYFFGTIETPETKITGVGSPSDIYMLILDKMGAVLKTRFIAGSDYDYLSNAEKTDNGFCLAVMAQSKDGDFEGSDSGGYPRDWVFTVSDDLEITERKMESGRDYYDRQIGVLEGKPVYLNQVLSHGVDAGTPLIFIRYDDFYLVVSSNVTGEYENTPPMISSIWYYTETVYSAYNDQGDLLFRAAMDSSQDFDAAAQAFYGEP